VEANAKMEQTLFRKFCDIAYERAGIRLQKGKEALVGARVARRQRALRIPTARKYLEFLESDAAGDEVIHFLDAISTNFTSFLREPEHFDRLTALVKRAVDSGKKRLRFWSAASSSGEEPYTMAITIAEAIGRADVDWRILATDISTQILERARAARYAQHTVDPLGKALRRRYFIRHKGAGGEDTFEVIPELRKRLVFKRINLAKPPFPMPGPLDAVFCRNVMIYFDRPVRQGLVGQIERLLAPGAELYIGHAETLTGIDHHLRTLGPSIYCKLGIAR
jgi:chemotaxis protein methyltransferase CheR